MKRFTSWIKRLYLVDSNSELRNRYAQMSSIELAFLLLGEGLRPEAIALARSMLIDRHSLKPSFTPSDVIDIEVNRLSARSRMCHICGECSPSESHDFLMCKKDGGSKVNLPDLLSGAAANLVTIPLLGAGAISINTSQRYQTVKLGLSLCHRCASKNKRITKDKCKCHPLEEYYRLSGFGDIMWSSELKSC